MFVKIHPNLQGHSTFHRLRENFKIRVCPAAHPSEECTFSISSSWFEDAINRQQFRENTIYLLLIPMRKFGEVQVIYRLFCCYRDCQFLIKTVDELVVSHAVATQLNKVIEIIMIVCHVLPCFGHHPAGGRPSLGKTVGTGYVCRFSVVSSVSVKGFMMADQFHLQTK